MWRDASRSESPLEGNTCTARLRIVYLFGRSPAGSLLGQDRVELSLRLRDHLNRPPALLVGAAHHDLPQGVHRANAASLMSCQFLDGLVTRAPTERHRPVRLGTAGIGEREPLRPPVSSLTISPSSSSSAGSGTPTRGLAARTPQYGVPVSDHLVAVHRAPRAARVRRLGRSVRCPWRAPANGDPVAPGPPHGGWERHRQAKPRIRPRTCVGRPSSDAPVSVRSCRALLDHVRHMRRCVDDISATRRRQVVGRP